MILQQRLQATGAYIVAHEKIRQARNTCAANAHEAQRLTRVAEEIAADMVPPHAMPDAKCPAFDRASEIEVEAVVPLEVRRLARRTVALQIGWRRDDQP